MSMSTPEKIAALRARIARSPYAAEIGAALDAHWKRAARGAKRPCAAESDDRAAARMASEMLGERVSVADLLRSERGE